MRKIKYLSFILIMFRFLSCTSEKTENYKQKIIRNFDTTIAKSIIQANILCKSDTEVSYALYIPKLYNNKLVVPIVIFFDPHAKGTFPVQKYKEIAEKFGWIIAGSNNSKNGLPSEITNAIGKTIKSDLLQRFAIDEKQIYLAGFSGGARVAGAIADADTGIAGVVGCSAGINANEQMKKNYAFIGIAGTNDMNYNELVNLNKTLDKSSIHHYLLTFEGKHEWAPVETMEDAFLWLHLNAVKDKKISLNHHLVSNFEEKYFLDAKTKLDKKEYFQGLISLKKIATFLDGVKDVSEYKKKIVELEALLEVKAIFGEKQKTESMEQSLQQAYLQAFQTKDETWWRIEIKKINDKISESSSPFEKAMLSRILGYLSLVSYSYVNRSLQSGDIKTAEHFNSIYGIVDPAISDHKFFEACIFASKGAKYKVMNSLHEAVSLGLDDSTLLIENNFLKSYITDKEFIKILKQISSKKE